YSFESLAGIRCNSREPARIAELTRRATAAQAAISVAKDCCRLRSPPWRRLPSRDLCGYRSSVGILSYSAGRHGGQWREAGSVALQRLQRAVQRSDAAGGSA